METIKIIGWVFIIFLVAGSGYLLTISVKMYYKQEYAKEKMERITINTIIGGTGTGITLGLILFMSQHSYLAPISFAFCWLVGVLFGCIFTQSKKK